MEEEGKFIIRKVDGEREFFIDFFNFISEIFRNILRNVHHVKVKRNFFRFNRLIFSILTGLLFVFFLFLFQLLDLFVLLIFFFVFFFNHAVMKAVVRNSLFDSFL